MSEETTKPGVVPTEGPLVAADELVGQNPYTDPPPMARRRFYEDPKPPGGASEQQVLQGRGAPPPYPPDDIEARVWNPRRYSNQMEAMRPADSKQPSEYEASNLSLAQFLALPQEQQDKILSEAKEGRSVGVVPEYKPQREVIADEDKQLAELERVRLEAEQRRNQAAAAGVGKMAPPTPGTLTSGSAGEPEEEE